MADPSKAGFEFPPASPRLPHGRDPARWRSSIRPSRRVGGVGHPSVEGGRKAKASAPRPALRAYPTRAVRRAPRGPFPGASSLARLEGASPLPRGRREPLIRDLQEACRFRKLAADGDLDVEVLHEGLVHAAHPVAEGSGTAHDDPERMVVRELVLPVVRQMSEPVVALAETGHLAEVAEAITTRSLRRRVEVGVVGEDVLLVEGSGRPPGEQAAVRPRTKLR